MLKEQYSSRQEQSVLQAGSDNENGGIIDGKARKQGVWKGSENMDPYEQPPNKQECAMERNLRSATAAKERRHILKTSSVKRGGE